MSDFLKEFDAFLKAWKIDVIDPMRTRLDSSLSNFDHRLRDLEAKFETRNRFWQETELSSEEELELLIKLLRVLRDN